MGILKPLEFFVGECPITGILIVVSALLYTLQKGVSIAPKNTYLASSAWPIAQYDSFSQASTPLQGPVDVTSADTLFSPEIAGPLTLIYSEDGKILWGSSYSSIFKVDRSQPTLKLIATYTKPIELISTDTFHGIYCLLSAEDIFYLQTAHILEAYTHEEEGNPFSGIKLIGRHDISNYHQRGEDELIQAVSLLYTGQIVYITTKGGIGVVTRDLKTLIDHIYIVSDLPISISNSFAIDPEGGIYAVSSRYMHRLWWDNKNQKLHTVNSSSPVRTVYSKPCEDIHSHKSCDIWSSPYPIDKEPILGRPTREGSGTTPTLFTDENTGNLYIAIADGKRKQKILIFDAHTGKLVASKVVSFSSTEPNGDSYTEQSILVSGNRLLITQNALTPPAQRLNSIMIALNAPERAAAHGIPSYWEENFFLLPVVMGDSPRGYEQFEFQTKGNSAHLVTTWYRDDIGCPNSIPTMSIPTGVMYCVGKKGPLGNYPSNGFNGAWTLEALDWNTGKTIFRAKTGNSFLYNSFYAATQIGPDQELIYGSLGGIVRLHSSTSPLGTQFENKNKLISALPFSMPTGDRLKAINYLRMGAKQMVTLWNPPNNDTHTSRVDDIITFPTITDNHPTHTHNETTLLIAPDGAKLFNFNPNSINILDTLQLGNNLFRNEGNNSIHTSRLRGSKYTHIIPSIFSKRLILNNDYKGDHVHKQDISTPNTHSNSNTHNTHSNSNTHNTHNTHSNSNTNNTHSNSNTHNTHSNSNTHNTHSNSNTHNTHSNSNTHNTHSNSNTDMTSYNKTHVYTQNYTPQSEFDTLFFEQYVDKSNTHTLVKELLKPEYNTPELQTDTLLLLTLLNSLPENEGVLPIINILRDQRLSREEKIFAGRFANLLFNQ